MPSWVAAGLVKLVSYCKVIYSFELITWYHLLIPMLNTAYNKWHETELERWLSDNDIPYPTPADRKDLEILIQKNWDSYAVSPYKNWDTDKLIAYLKTKGVETKDSIKSNKDSLVNQVANAWYETEDKAQTGWTSVQEWIFDTWTDSALKAFADKHGIPGNISKYLSVYLISC